MAPPGKVFLWSWVMNDSGCDTVKNDFVSMDTAPLGKIMRHQVSDANQEEHENNYDAVLGSYWSVFSIFNDAAQKDAMTTQSKGLNDKNKTQKK